MPRKAPFFICQDERFRLTAKPVPAGRAAGTLRFSPTISGGSAAPARMVRVRVPNTVRRRITSAGVSMSSLADAAEKPQSRRPAVLRGLAALLRGELPPDPGPDPTRPNLPKKKLDRGDLTRDFLTGDAARWDKPECTCPLSVRCPHGYGQPTDWNGHGLLAATAYLRDPDEVTGGVATWTDAEGKTVYVPPPDHDAADGPALYSLGALPVAEVWFRTAGSLRGCVLTAKPDGTLHLPGDDHPPHKVRLRWRDLRGQVFPGRTVDTRWRWEWDGRYSPDHGMDADLWRMFIEAEAPEKFEDRPLPPASTVTTHRGQLNELRKRHRRGFGLWNLHDAYDPNDPYVRVCELAQLHGGSGLVLVEDGHGAEAEEEEVEMEKLFEQTFVSERVKTRLEMQRGLKQKAVPTCPAK